MQIGESVRTSYEEIKGHPLRSILTLLGVILGTLALVVVMSVLDGVQGSVLKGLNDLGLDGGPLYDPLGNYRNVARGWNDWASDPQHDPVATRTVAPQELPPAPIVTDEIVPGTVLTEPVVTPGVTPPQQ